MKRSNVRGLATLLLTVGLTLPAFDAAAHGPPTHGVLALPATTACLDAAVATGRANGALSGIAAVVVLDGHIVYHRGFGTVSPTSTQAVLPSTRFRIGSVTKMMTATALLSLVDEHRLHLHAPVTQLLPGFTLPGEPGWSDSLNAHLLLSHQGAMPDSVGLRGPVDDGALAAAFFDPGFTSTVPLMVPPGTFYNYSSPNFMLAGLLAETAAGKPYREVVRERVFEPLGMTRAAFLASEVAQDNDVAFGVLAGAVIAPGDYDNAIGRPAGFAWDSADDLAKFMTFLMRGNREVLSPRLWRTMQTRQVNTFQALDRQGYGYGLVIEDGVAVPDSQGVMRFHDARAVWHNGAIAGYQSLLMTLPGQQFGYAVLANADETAASVDLSSCFRVAAGETVRDRLPPPLPFPDPQIQRDRFGDYVGTYSERVGFGPAIVTLTSNGDLSIRLPRFDALGLPYDPVLHPYNRDNFILNALGRSVLVTGFREGDSSVFYLRTRFTVFQRNDQAQTGQALQRAAAPAATTIDRREIEQAVRAASMERTTLLP